MTAKTPAGGRSIVPRGEYPGLVVEDHIFGGFNVIGIDGRALEPVYKTREEAHAVLTELQAAAYVVQLEFDV